MRKRVLILRLVLIILAFSVPTCKPPEPPPEIIEVEVCSESGLLPNEYCPETEIREFEKGKEPTEYCDIHQAPEITKIISSGCYDLLTADGDWRAFLKKIDDIGANGFRFFAIQCFGQKDRLKPFQPYPVVGTWKHPDTNKTFPLFQLRDQDNKNPIWNEDWWDKYKAILKEAKAAGLTAHLVADTYTDLKKGKDEKYNHPWYCSKEALKDYPPPTPGGVWGEAMKKYHVDLWKRMIKEARDIGTDFTFEISNEYDAKDWDDEFMISWHKWAVEEVKKIYPKIIIIASASRNALEIKKQVDIYSCHGYVRPEKIDQVKEKWGEEKELLVSGDGGFDGDGPADKNGRKGASPEQMRGIAQKFYEYDYAGYEYFDRGLYQKNNDRANLDDFHEAPLAALVDECRKIEKSVSTIVSSRMFLYLEIFFRDPVFNPYYEWVQNVSIFLCPIWPEIAHD